MPKVPYPYELQIGHGKWFLNTNLFLIKPFLITKFDCKKNILLLYIFQKEKGKKNNLLHSDVTRLIQGC
jgi:hypothetical protein